MKKELVIEFIEASNLRNWDKVLTLVHPDFIRHSSSAPHLIKTNKGLVNFHKNELLTFPDLKEEIVYLKEEQDLVVARIEFSGTQIGFMGDVPPSGKKLIARFNCSFRVSESKIMETWVEYDNLNGLSQPSHYKIN